MYLFNIKKLKKDIIEQKLTEKEKCKYLFVMIILYSSSIFIAINEVDKYYTDAIIEIWWFIFEIFLLMMSYKLFKKYKSKDFLGKFLSLNFVLGIRFLFVIFLFFVFLKILFAIMNELKFMSLPPDFNALDGIFFIISFSFIGLIYYYRLYIHLKEVVMLENNKNVSLQHLSADPS
ncbi:hypothetical protein [Spirobacillus cienkowskii]|uniref:hypothetical protein n=1 Tax=Spirobacillus cienkowskii TaxID=495820 RepID=UPI0030D37313